MIGIVGGFVAAACWTTSTVCSARAARLLGPSVAMAWVMLIGLVVTVPVAPVLAPDVDVVPADLVRAGVAAAGSAVGLVLLFASYRLGKIGVIAPIVACEGAVAAVMAVILGEPLSAVAGVMLGVITLGVLLASVGRHPEDDHRTVRHGRIAAALAITAAVTFGTSLNFGVDAGEALGPFWVMAASRAVGAALVALPVVAARRLRLSREALPFLVGAGVCEVAGFAAILYAGRDGVAVPAVIASQFAVAVVILGWLLFGERLSRVQLAGVAATVAGVAVLALVQA